MAQILPASIPKLLQDRRNEILQLAARRGARNVRIFGSIARGDAIEGSKTNMRDDRQWLLDILWAGVENDLPKLKLQVTALIDQFHIDEAQNNEASKDGGND